MGGPRIVGGAFDLPRLSFGGGRDAALLGAVPAVSSLKVDRARLLLLLLLLGLLPIASYEVGG